MAENIRGSVEAIADDVDAIAVDVGAFVDETVKTETKITGDLERTTKAARLLFYVASASIVVATSAFILRRIFK